MADAELIPPRNTPGKIDPIVGFEKRYDSAKPSASDILDTGLRDMATYKSEPSSLEPEMMTASTPAEWEEYFTPGDEMLTLFKKILAEPGSTAMKEFAKLANTPSFRLALEIGKHDDQKLSDWKKTYEEYCEKALNSLKSFPSAEQLED
jgi:hypothetical protein